MVVPPSNPWEVTLVAGQFIFGDNNEFASTGDLSTDPMIFDEQLIVKYNFTKDVSVTLAPGFMAESAGHLTGLRNTLPFTDESAVAGVNPLPAITGETRALHILTAPGDISFKLAGLKSKIYWDFAYNVSGRDRFDNVYQLKSFGSRDFKPRDGLAWLVGLQLGETKKKGDWQFYVNYRESGIASVDPNLNDSDFALSALNTRGFKIGLAYALNDFVVLNATGYITWNLDNDLFGGRATSVGGIAPYNASNEVQLDVNIKF
ncbi:MAG: putative porin [Chthoniobacter sp.]